MSSDDAPDVAAEGAEDPVARVHDDIRALEERWQAWREHTITPRFEALEEQSDDARADRAELRAMVEDVQNQIANLRFEVEQIKGLGDNQESNPAARVRDLRSTMIQRAKSLKSRPGIKLWWEEVQEVFVDLNHGEIRAPECYAAMEDAAEADGFEMTTKVNGNGNEVKAIRLKTTALPGQEAVSDSKNAEGVSPRQNGGDPAVESKQD